MGVDLPRERVGKDDRRFILTGIEMRHLGRDVLVQIMTMDVDAQSLAVALAHHASRSGRACGEPGGALTASMRLAAHVARCASRREAGEHHELDPSSSARLEHAEML